MKWEPRHATGIEEIDQQHKTLFEASENYRLALEAGTGRNNYDLFIEFLVAFIEVHFANEEECMFAYRCPAAKQNKLEHAGIAKFIQAENARFEAEGFSLERATALLAMVDQWLDGHIGRIDVQLKPCVEQGKPDQA